MPPAFELGDQDLAVELRQKASKSVTGNWGSLEQRVCDVWVENAPVDRVVIEHRIWASTEVVHSLRVVFGEDVDDASVG